MTVARRRRPEIPKLPARLSVDEGLIALFDRTRGHIRQRAQPRHERLDLALASMRRLGEDVALVDLRQNGREQVVWLFPVAWI